ncbi:hypothetical protein KR018_006421 [Drosophila ironensis]|nr:hypothetical protein KR018_006421 [Drosophila ironensis]
MVVPSKLLEPPLNRIPCSILHSRPGQSCTKAFLWNVYRNHVSSGKYYLPLLLIPLVIKCRNLNKKTIQSIVLNYAQACSFAACINASTYYFICMTRRSNGRFVFIFTPFLSCWLASQLAWWMPPKLLLYFGTGIIHAALESFMRYFHLPLVGSRLDQTLVFMICSFIVLHHQQARKYPGFWFIRPAPLPENYRKISVEKRLKQILKEMSTYLGIGLALDLINPIRKRSLKNLRLKSASFLVAYYGFFKLLQSLFLTRFNLKVSNGLAAFGSGASYSLLNRLTFMCFAVVTASQVTWQQVCSKDSKKDPQLAAVQRIPWAKLLIPCSLAYLVHMFFFHTHHLNKLARDFIDSTCDKNGQRLLDLINLPDMKTLLETVNKLPKISFLF